MLPAYGRELLEVRQAGKRPKHPVSVTIDWDIAKSIKRQDRFVLVMVAGETFLDCSMLADLDVVVLDVLDWPANVSRRALNAIRFGRPRSVEYRTWDWARDDPTTRRTEQEGLDALIRCAQARLEGRQPTHFDLALAGLAGKWER